MENPFGRLVGLASKAMRRRLNRNIHEAGHELTAVQWVLLANLVLHEGMNQHQIGELLEQDKTATTRLIDALEKKKLAVRVADGRDRRQKILHVTDEGRRQCADLMPLAIKTHKEALHDIPDDEIELCKSVLRRVIDNLN
jgi:MarR family transcriptional regulator, transcriptional regulator for hemolysin